MAKIRTRLKTRARAYGDGSIVELQPGRFRVQVSAGRDASGKRIRLSAYALSADEARAKKAELLQLRHAPSGVQITDRGLTVGAYLDAWVEKKRDVETTHHFRLDKLRPVKQHLGHIRLHALTEEHISHLINTVLREGAEKRSPQTRAHVRSVLRTALKDACNDGKIRLALNPAIDVKVKGFRSDEFDPRILSDAEYAAFLKGAARFDELTRKTAGTDAFHSMEAAWVLFCERGLREGELLGLCRNDIDLEAGKVKIHRQLQRRRGQGSRKGKARGTGENLVHVRLKTKSSRRTLRLTPRCVEALQRHFAHQAALGKLHGGTWNPRGMVFPTPTGIPMQGAALTHEYFRPLCRLAGITFSDQTHPGGVRIHDLRHTFATRHLKQHKNLLLTRTVMGHSSVKMTERYIHLAGIDENVEDPVAG